MLKVEIEIEKRDVERILVGAKGGWGELGNRISAIISCFVGVFVGTLVIFDQNTHHPDTLDTGQSCEEYVAFQLDDFFR